MGLAEDKAHARSAGTERRNTVKKVVQRIVITVVIIMLTLIPAYNFAVWKLSPETSVAATTPPRHTTTTTAEVIWPRNTDRNCPGIISPLQPLGTTEVKFNPNGCYFYALGKGTVKFAGLFFGTYEVDLETGQGSKESMKVYTARSAGGLVLWQYILCAGPKQDPMKLDCS